MNTQAAKTPAPTPLGFHNTLESCEEITQRRKGRLVAEMDEEIESTKKFMSTVLGLGPKLLLTGYLREIFTAGK